MNEQEPLAEHQSPSMVSHLGIDEAYVGNVGVGWYNWMTSLALHGIK